MPILLLIMYLFVMPVFAADVYRSVDENGNIIYTDKPTPDAEKIRIDEIQTIEPPDTPEFTYTPPTPRDEPSQYKVLKITSPADGDAIEDAAGNLSVSVSVEPALSPGHKIALFVDGNKTGEGGGSFNLQNVDRGTHSLSAAILDNAGNELIRSGPVSVTLHRHSKLHPESTVGKPPPPPPP